MITTGIKSGVRKYLLLMSMFMFLVSAGYWILKVINFFQLISLNLIGGLPALSIRTPVSNAQSISGAFVLINYALTDAVVLWRAWVLCSTDFKKSLYVPLCFLCCASSIYQFLSLIAPKLILLYLATILATIIIRITIQSIPLTDEDPQLKKLTRAIDICQVANVAFSLLLNLTSTALIAIKAWRFRRWIRFDLEALKSQRTKGEKIMALLIESGLLYCLSGITVLVSTLVRLPHGTLGDIYTPMNTQIASSSWDLLVNHGNTLEKTVLMRDISDAVATPHDVQVPRAGGSGPQESIRLRGGRSQTDVSEAYSRSVVSTQISEVVRSPVRYSPAASNEGGLGDTGFGPVKSDIKYTLKYMDGIRE
ncbi:hypothetical protein V5O48_009972 [Marasmius crinis-equi]|uniref:Uncharacterized protein n=1 Tax=Marasmius crinis-equi TaxID=585013 RepID=A0ABR3F9S8_9AGAR